MVFLNYTARCFLYFKYFPMEKLSHGKEAKLPFRRVPDVPEPGVIERLLAKTLNRNLKMMSGSMHYLRA